MFLALKKPPTGATIAALLGFIFLCSLGIWQLQRLEWKNQKIAAIEDAYSQKANRSFRAIDYEASKDLSRGRVQGRFVPAQNIQVGLGENTALYQLVRLQNGGYLMVNLGMTNHKAAMKKDWLRGTLYPYPTLHSFIPRNDLARRQFFAPQQKDFATLFSIKTLKPVILYPDALHTKPMLRNNHLGYALFWFGMAGTLVVIFVLRFMLQSATKMDDTADAPEQSA